MSIVKYPTAVAHQNFHGVKDQHTNRGMRLEADLNDTNKYYRECDKALIYKKPTPVQVVRVDYPARNKAKIVEAYYKTPSTTDYNGIYKHGGIGFFVIRFSLRNETFLIDAPLLIDKIEHSSKSSIPYSWFQEHGHLIQEGYIPRLDYLKIVDLLYFKEDKT